MPGAELADFVDDDDAVAIERVLPAFDPLEKGGHGGAFLDAGRAQIAGLSPGERYAEDVSSLLPSRRFSKRGKRGAFAGARDADRDTEAATGGELGHHRALRLPLRGGAIDRRMAFKECVRRTLDQSGRQRGRRISRSRFGEADQFTLLVGVQVRSSHSSVPCRARRRPWPREAARVGRPAGRHARGKLW